MVWWIYHVGILSFFGFSVHKLEFVLIARVIREQGEREQLVRRISLKMYVLSPQEVAMFLPCKNIGSIIHTVICDISV